MRGRAFVLGRLKGGFEPLSLAVSASRKQQQCLTLSISSLREGEGEGGICGKTHGEFRRQEDASDGGYMFCVCS